MTEQSEIDELKEFINKIELLASNKTKNYINSMTSGYKEIDALRFKCMFYDGYSAGWDDRTTYLSCAGCYPLDEELKE